MMVPRRSKRRNRRKRTAKVNKVKSLVAEPGKQLQPTIKDKKLAPIDAHHEGRHYIESECSGGVQSSYTRNLIACSKYICRSHMQ